MAKQKQNTKLKRGPVSKDDLEKLAAWRDIKPVKEIAKLLNRSENFVRKETAGLPEREKKLEHSDWVSRLHASEFWVDVRRGLIGSEVGYFEQAWAAYMDQFGSASDILATDELMIKDLVMLDIFAQRAIAEQANIIRRINQLEDLIQKEEDKLPEDRDHDQLSSWRTQLNSLYAARGAVGKQHLDYQHRKDVKLRDLKGSRDQRFKQIEESRRNIFELIKDLDTHRKRMEEGRLNEKIRIASEKVAEDWGQVMDYGDNRFDKPFLSPEGELEDDKQTIEEAKGKHEEKFSDES